MKKQAPLFDRSKLKLLPLKERKHDMTLADVVPLRPQAVRHRDLAAVADRIRRARARGAAVVLMIGAHVLKNGLQRYVLDWMEQGWITCLAMNGAGVIHDYELALIGATTESVAHYISNGQFGLWRETGEINDVILRAARRREGLGYAVGRAIEEGKLPYREVSLLAAGYRLEIPVTIHVGVGYDIIHEHPNCDGAAVGQTSYHDFLVFTRQLEQLEHGVVMNFGSAVMAPEVYLKSLAMVRNVAQRRGKEIAHFTTLVCDLLELPKNHRKEAKKFSLGYYYRPWKTMLARTVADGGESFYVRALHRETIPQLWTALLGR